MLIGGTASFSRVPFLLIGETTSFSRVPSLLIGGLSLTVSLWWFQTYLNKAFVPSINSTGIEIFRQESH